MHKTAAKSFSAPLERLRARLNWIIVRIPFDVKKTWGAGGLFKVKGEINGFPFRTSLFPTKASESAPAGHFLLVNKKMQRGGHAFLGTMARFRLEPDTEARVATIPPELKRLLAEDRAFLRWYEQFNYTTRNEISKWITDVKSPDARQRRAEQMAERLLSTMDAERELPPLIQLAFARQPRAREGWELMSPAQRRGQLLAIFYYRTPESRARRLQKVVEGAIACAERKKPTT